MDLSGATWRKASRSGSNGGDCVEVASVGGGRMAVRDSKNPNGGVLVLTAGEWQALIGGVKDGEFDHRA